MMRSFGKVISMMLVLMLVAMLAPANIIIAEPLEGEDPVRVLIPFENYGHARGDSSNASKPQKYSTNTSYGQHYINIAGSWLGYAQLDLSGYEEILQNPSTKTTIELMAGNGFTSYLFDFKVYLAPDSADGYNRDTLTHNQAGKLGMNDTSRPVIASRSDETVVSDATLIKNDGIRNGTVVSFDANKEHIVNVLGESNTNSLVTLFFKAEKQYTWTNSSGTKKNYSSVLTMADKNGKISTGLVIEYYKSEIDDNSHFEAIKSDFTWDNLSSDSAEELKSSLPNYFRGATIEWMSDKAELKVSSDGTLKQPRDGTVSGTLTANVSYKGYDFSKDFDVTVAKLEPVTKVVKSTSADVCQVSVNYPDSFYAPSSNTYYPVSGVMYNQTSSGRGSDIHAFVRIDLSDYVKYVEAATDISFTLVNRNDSTSRKAMVAVLSDRFDNWTFGSGVADGLTYNKAIDEGLYTDSGYGIFYGAYIPKINVAPEALKSPQLTQAIKDAVAVNPDEGLVTFRVSSNNWEGISFQLSGSAGYPYVTITYYEEDIMTSDELVDEKKGSLPWTRLTSQDIDNVVADLDLPATWYGAPVTWTSSDENIISLSGEVAIGSESKNVTLTATVDGAVNTFNVTVPANKIATKSHIMHRVSYSNGGSNLNYSSAEIYANSDIEGTPDVIIATYDSNGMLTEIKVKENVSIKEGFLCVPSDYHYVASKYATTKAFVVDDIETLNPLGIAR